MITKENTKALVLACNGCAEELHPASERLEQLGYPLNHTGVRRWAASYFAWRKLAHKDFCNGCYVNLLRQELTG